MPISMGDSKNDTKDISQQYRSTSKYKNILHLKEEENKRPKGQKEEIIQISAEINEIKTKKTIEKITEAENCFF